MPSQFISKSAEDTQNFAKKIAAKGKWRIYGLVGDLGSGKTTFAQAFLRALGVRQTITSPTFVIIKKYQFRNQKSEILNHKSKICFAYHIDCYRLRDPKELLDLGFQKILDDPKNIILIEWADKIKNLLPPKTKWIHFEHGENENERRLKY